MRFIHLINKKIALALLTIFTLTNVMAQTTPPVQTVTSGNNLLAILLIVMTIVLAFVLWGLGQVLVVLSRQLLEKNKNATKIITTLVVITSLLFSQSLFAQDTTKEVVKELPNYGGLSENTFYMFVAVIATEIFAVLFIAFSIRRVYSELVPKKKLDIEHKSALSTWWSSLDKKIFTKAVPVEKEADVLLDHDYDGIRELDNALPPWWKYGFYITVVVAVVYFFNFEVFGYGKNPTQEYAAEMEKAKQQKEIFEATNKDKIDESNVPMADAAGLTRAKEIFDTKCFTCHGKLGEGGAGPNLADNYWMHKGALNDIYSSIKVGYPDKGMQSWITEFTPKEISYLASYVKKFHGTNPPNAKAPQGDLFTDSIKATIKVDTASLKKI